MGRLVICNHINKCTDLPVLPMQQNLVISNTLVHLTQKKQQAFQQLGMLHCKPNTSTYISPPSIWPCSSLTISTILKSLYPKQIMTSLRLGVGQWPKMTVTFQERVTPIKQMLIMGCRITVRCLKLNRPKSQEQMPSSSMVVVMVQQPRHLSLDLFDSCPSW